MTAKRLLIHVCVVSLAGVASLAQNSIPVPPVKPGLWETRMSQLDANGQEVPSPEFAALSKMPPEQREKMAEAMRARGVQLPDANGTMKACLSKESLDSAAWQQPAADELMTKTQVNAVAGAIRTMVIGHHPSRIVRLPYASISLQRA